MFDKTKEIFHGMRELTDEIDLNYLIYYFKDDTCKKRSYYFNNGIEHFQKIKSGEMKLEEEKKSSRINLNLAWTKYQEEIQMKRVKNDNKKYCIALRIMGNYYWII